jgi:hypothetical protein
MRHYVQLEDKPAIHIHSVAEGRLHSVFLGKTIWAELMRCRVSEKRSISAILEQQLRAYVALPLSDNESDR